MAVDTPTAYNLNVITTLYGEDSYRRLKKLNELISFFVQKRGACSHERLSLEKEEDFQRLESFVSTPPMFGPKKLLILDNPFQYADTKKLKSILRSRANTDDINVIINTEKKFASAFKFLTELPNIFYEFGKLQGKELDKFIRGQASELSLELTQPSITKIKDFLGSDTWRIATELERLSLTKGTNIEGGKTAVNYFFNINEIKKGGTVGQRVVALEELLSGGRYDAERLFNGLAFRLNSETEAEMYADYNTAVRAGRLDYEEVLVAVSLGLKFNPLNW
ncbi:MAG: hypothetical protein PHV43_00455 [Candidatus Colwellbacteria bacterium]|nr:hypothetical protein [Candidatus Colwellbacteria bacterium]